MLLLEFCLIPFQVPEKEMNEAPCGCKSKCIDKLTHEEKKKIFNGFWKLSSFDVQNAYLCGAVKSVAIKRRYTSKGENSRRKFSRLYYVHNGSLSVQVCKTAFLQLHGISSGRLSRVLQRQQRSGGSPPLDQRGRHEPANKSPEEGIRFIKEHISKIPRYKSHYSRSDNPNREYISPELNITKMYSMYKEECALNGISVLSEWVYRKVFNECFNLSFGR